MKSMKAGEEMRPQSTGKADGGLLGSIAIALALMAAAMLLFVLPGHWLYLAGDLPFGRFFGKVHGDNLLPIAMQVQLLWAVAVPFAHALVRWLVGSRRGAEGGRAAGGAGAAVLFWLALAGLLYAWAVLLAVMFHSLAAQPAA